MTGKYLPVIWMSENRGVFAVICLFRKKAITRDGKKGGGNLGAVETRYMPYIRHCNCGG